MSNRILPGVPDATTEDISLIRQLCSVDGNNGTVYIYDAKLKNQLIALGFVKMNVLGWCWGTDKLQRALELMSKPVGNVEPKIRLTEGLKRMLEIPSGRNTPQFPNPASFNDVVGWIESVRDFAAEYSEHYTATAICHWANWHLKKPASSMVKHALRYELDVESKASSK